MKKVVLLDFDGVILDSVPIKDQAFLNLFSDHSVEVQENARRFWASTRGMDRSKRIQQGFWECSNIKHTGSDLTSILRRYQIDIERSLISAPWIQGAIEFLSASQKHHIFVVSAAPQIEIRNIVVTRGIDHYIDSVFGGPSSKISNIKTILAKLNKEPEQAIFVGDMLSDLEVAAALLIPFVGVVKEGTSSPFPPEVKLVSDLRHLSFFLNGESLVSPKT